MISVEEAARHLRISVRRVRQLLAEERIAEAQKVSGVWVIPDDLEVLPPSRPVGRPRKVAE